jgi:hypothetical protein
MKVLNNVHMLILSLSLMLFCKAEDMNSMRAPRPNAEGNNALVGETVICDFGESNHLIQTLQGLIQSCCNQLEHDFSLLDLDLVDLKNTLSVCCENLAFNFEGTFTQVADLKNKIILCCEDITDEFNATFSTLAAGFSSTFTEISNIDDMLNNCCEQIQNNFQLMVLALNNIMTNITCTVACGAIPITAPITITTPGSYCLSNDINGPIIIIADDVTLNLNDHNIRGLGAGSGTGLIINPGSNRIINKGRISNFDTGIMCDSAMTTEFKNIVVNDCAVEGITINNSSVTVFDSLIITDILGIGVHFTGINNNASVIKKVTVTNSQQGFIFDHSANSFIQECFVLDCSSVVLAQGFAVMTGSFNQFSNCTVKNLSSLSPAQGFFIESATDTLIQDCTIQNVASLLSARGFSSDPLATALTLWHCSVLDVRSVSDTAGFELGGTDITALYCLAQACQASNLNATGFLCTGTNLVVMSCQAFSCQAAGFNSSSLNSMFQGCQSSYNDNGFIITDSNTLVGTSIASHNVTTGFNVLAGTSLYHCFASANGTDYIGAPNVQNTNTQVDNAVIGLTGPFAGRNMFM